MSLWKWLGLDRSAETGEADGVDRLEQALAGLEPATARHVACFAYILTRSARADHVVTDGEAREMERIVAGQGGIPLDLAATLIALARKEALRSGGTDDFIVTREFNRIATREQKLTLLDALFAVSGVDESILTIEDNEIRRVANELMLEHADFIAVRARHRSNLAVMRDKPGPGPAA
jgi:uncharacterized tellurite resistance protein B-like protein